MSPELETGYIAQTIDEELFNGATVGSLRKTINDPDVIKDLEPGV